MWNAADVPYVIYYGASFIDYIGHIENPITMVYPSNGKNYDSFIFGQYFDTVILGASAADDITLEAISLIDKLPETVSLDDRAAVEAARAAYDAISTLEQRALVTNYSKLTEAEDRIEKLLTLENPEETTPPTAPEDPKLDPTTIIIIILTALLAAAVVTIIIVDCVRLGKKAKAESEKEGENNDENDK